jgi:hypothetical protein
VDGVIARKPSADGVPARVVVRKITCTHSGFTTFLQDLLQRTLGYVVEKEPETNSPLPPYMLSQWADEVVGTQCLWTTYRIRLLMPMPLKLSATGRSNLVFL